MPVAKLILRPGVDVERTPTLNQGGISSCQLIRFYEGLVQKYGGWQQLPAVPAFIGTCRGLLGWADLAGNAYLAVGTEQRLEVFAGGAAFDITPLRATDNVAVAFSTSAGSPAVTIMDATTEPEVGDWINITTQVSVGGLIVFGYYLVQTIVSGTQYTITAAANATGAVTNGGAVPLYTTTNGSATVTVTLDSHGFVANSVFNALVSTAVGGLTVAGTYAVASVIDANNFTITAGTLATSGASASENGGDVQIQYLISSGVPVNTFGQGWGAGDWGAGDWGLANSGSVFTALRQWSMGHFGQDLLANPSGAPIYYWAPPTPAPAAILSSTAPAKVIASCVMSQAQIVLAAGAESGGTLYPVLIRWSDSGDFTDWTPTAANQAGSFQLPSGATVVAVLAIGLETLIWTDSDLWSMTYVGLPFVFAVNRVAADCEALSLRCPVVVNGERVVWITNRGFFLYSGGTLDTLPCPVWDFIFDNLDFTQTGQVFSARNTLFNEVGWFFPNAATGLMNYVKWNFLDNLWDYGVLDRTAWIDHSVYGNPIGADSTGLLQQHEIGNDANGQPMAWNWRTGFFDLSDGTTYSFLDFVIPDFLGSYTQINMTIFAVDAPNQPQRSYGPFALTPTTPYVNVRVRGRQIAVEFSGNDMGSFNRLGAVRYRVAPAGRR